MILRSGGLVQSPGRCLLNDLAVDHRASFLRHALRLEWLTIGWNVVEGVVAVTAAVLAGSVALLGFGIDSFVESASGAVLIWRLRSERRVQEPEAIASLDRTAHRWVAATLFVLAAYIAIDASWTLWRQERPRPTLVGVVLTVV